LFGSPPTAIRSALYRFWSQASAASGYAGVYNVKTCLLILLMLMLLACRRESQPAGPMRHYPLTGKIVSLDARHQTAMIDAAAIPNYMEAMTMEYPIKSKSDFDALRVGERITATIDVASDESYTLSNVKEQSAGK
jgi:Cu/Ag efflux protein CusF